MTELDQSIRLETAVLLGDEASKAANTLLEDVSFNNHAGSHPKVWTDHVHGRERINVCANGNQLYGMALEAAGVKLEWNSNKIYNVVTKC